MELRAVKSFFRLVHTFAIVCLPFSLMKGKKKKKLSFSVGGRRWSLVAFKH